MQKVGAKVPPLATLRPHLQPLRPHKDEFLSVSSGDAWPRGASRGSRQHQLHILGHMSEPTSQLTSCLDQAVCT